MLNLVSDTERKERSLRMFENRVLRRVFGPKRDEVMREWRKTNEMGRACGMYGGG
jgi:hypothetical protein